MSLRPHCVALLCLVAAGCTRSNLDAILGAKDDGGSVNDASHVNDANDASDVNDASDTTDANDASKDSDANGGTVLCPSPALKAGDSTVTIQMGSTSRSYVLHVPAKYDGSKPAPLIVDFHAQNGSGSNQRTISPYPAQTDPEGVVMAFPTGLKGPGGAAWNVGPCCVADVDDVAFAKALVQDVKKVACIDANRVYAVGLATGGGMAYQLACRAADVFAAVAPAAFDLLDENVDECKPSRSITVISFRGTADPLVPYEGGLSTVVLTMPITFLGAQKTFKKWAEIDQCTDSPSAEDSNGCASYSACQGGVEVILCTKQGGGLEAGNASVAWPVLRRHTR